MCNLYCGFFFLSVLRSALMTQFVQCLRILNNQGTHTHTNVYMYMTRYTYKQCKDLLYTISRIIWACLDNAQMCSLSILVSCTELQTTTSGRQSEYVPKSNLKYFVAVSRRNHWTGPRSVGFVIPIELILTPVEIAWDDWILGFLPLLPEKWPATRIITFWQMENNCSVFYKK